MTLLFAADLMLPGLVVPPAGLPQVQKGDLCAVALVGNRYWAVSGASGGTLRGTLGGAGMTASQLVGKGLKEKTDSFSKIPRVGLAVSLWSVHTSGPSIFVPAAASPFIKCIFFSLKNFFF